MKDDDRLLCNFRLPKDIYDRMKQVSKEKYISMTDYIIQLVLEDIQKNKPKNDIR